ncbi:hypothetical protein EMN47_10575 [Prolixibacteraceae bacterium JC049]|nr:hypothetical protein [Prolixibacteraceae bacterium JC049]
MEKFLKIDYSEMLEQFKLAEASSNRLLLGETETKVWLQTENVCESKLMNICKQFTDPRIFIIANGDYKGLYVYSKQQQICIKYDNAYSFLEIDD